MRCAANSIFDCAGVLKCTPSNQIIEVCKQVAKWTANSPTVEIKTVHPSQIPFSLLDRQGPVQLLFS